MVPLVAITRVRWQGRRRPGEEFVAPEDVAAELLALGAARRGEAAALEPVVAPPEPLDRPGIGIGAPAPDESGRDAQIAEAVALLDPADDEHWTQTGRPRVSVVENIVGFDIAREELDGFHRPEPVA